MTPWFRLIFEILLFVEVSCSTDPEDFVNTTSLTFPPHTYRSFQSRISKPFVSLCVGTADKLTPRRYHGCHLPAVKSSFLSYRAPWQTTASRPAPPRRSLLSAALPAFFPPDSGHPRLWAVITCSPLERQRWPGRIWPTSLPADGSSHRDQTRNAFRSSQEFLCKSFSMFVHLDTSCSRDETLPLSQHQPLGAHGTKRLVNEGKAPKPSPKPQASK